MTIYLHEFIKSSLVDLHHYLNDQMCGNKKKGYHISYRISNFKAQKKRPDVRKCLTETLLPQPLL
ncbi:unnamed protein product [Brassica rapa]|uniref:Uncharacterized protein n=1 Tax=Brassica campestris TaxID=3711 RepID=A0A8D9HMJ0_BRACM|nr:unnamed protein product [Brassica rapa]